MVGVGVIVAIRDTRDDTELLTVLLRELTAEALGRCSQHRIVMMITITELVHSITHVSDDLQTQFLTLGTLAMVFSCKSHQTFSQTYETYTQRTLINDTLDGIHRSQFLGTDPKTLHQQRELLGEGRLLELETIVELFGCHFEHIIEFGKEHIDALLLVLLIHTLYGKLHNVDGGEGEVTTSDGSLGSETILEHTCTTTHRGHLVYIALRVVSTPLAILIIRSIEVQEVGEESTCRHLTSQLIQVEVTILGQIVHTTLLLPNLNGEDSSLASTHALISRKQDLTHDATSLGRGIGTVVNGGEHHLVTTTRMDGIHVVDKGLHRLMHTTYRLIDGVLLGTFLTLQPVERFLDIVYQRLVVKILVTLTIEILQSLQLLNITHTHIRSQIEIESRDSLTSVHLVLAALH